MTRGKGAEIQITMGDLRKMLIKEQQPREIPSPKESTMAVELCNAARASEQPRPLDPKKLRRLISNRQSSERSRIKTRMKVMDLENKCRTLLNEVNELPRAIASSVNQRSDLKRENDELRWKMFSLMQEKYFKEAQGELLKRDVEQLNQFHQQQWETNFLEA